MLMIKLSQKYKVSITHIMTYNTEKQCLSNVFKLKISDNNKKVLHKYDCYNKKDLISELMAWQK